MASKESNTTPKKMGRPKEENIKSRTINMRFSEDELKAIDNYIKKHNFDSRSGLIRQAIKDKITQLDAFRDA
jgi:metal-responsive CopG/Arc/MetJ family transcriptional regulator